MSSCDLAHGQGPRLALEAQAGDRRGRHRRGPGRARDLLAAAVEQLDEQAGAVRADRVAEPRGRRARSPGKKPPIVCAVSRPRGVDGGGLEEDRADAAAGPRLVVGEQVVGGQVVVDQAGLVRGRDDAVAQLTGPTASGDSRWVAIGAHRRRAGPVPVPWSGQGRSSLGASARGGRRSRGSSRARSDRHQRTSTMSAEQDQQRAPRRWWPARCWRRPGRRSSRPVAQARLSIIVANTTGTPARSEPSVIIDMAGIV